MIDLKYCPVCGSQQGFSTNINGGWLELECNACEFEFCISSEQNVHDDDCLCDLCICAGCGQPNHEGKCKSTWRN